MAFSEFKNYLFVAISAGGKIGAFTNKMYSQSPLEFTRIPFVRGGLFANIVISLQNVQYLFFPLHFEKQYADDCNFSSCCSLKFSIAFFFFQKGKIWFA